MAPSRSKKRNSTVQALDILNNVGNANHNGLRSRVQHPSRRQLQPEVQIPQSDDIWDIPNSPEKRQDGRRRVADSEPITPRRSARYRPQLEEPEADNASSGKWLRSRASVNYKEGIQGGEDGNDKDGSEEEDNNEDSEADEEGDLRLFSEDDTPKTTRSNRPSSRKQTDKEEFPDLPSPSALFRGDGFAVSPSASTSEQDPDASEDSDSGEEAPNAPKTTQKPETNKTQNEEESGSSEDESSSEEASKSPPNPPRPIVQINLAQGTSQGLSSPRSARHRESRNGPATRETNQTPTQQQAHNESNQEKDSSGSSYETEDGESDSSSSSEESTELPPDEDDLPVPRQSKRRRVEPDSHSRRQSLRNQEAAPSLGAQEAGNTRGQSLQSDSEEDDDYNDEDEEHEEEEEDEAAKEAEKAKEEENARKLQWMEEAMNIGQQRTNWLVVNSKAKELKRIADPFLAKYFVDICAAIHELHEIYADMVDTPPSHADLVQCNNLLASIPHEGDGLLDQAYHMATQDSNYSDGEEHARDLVDEFEARVLPDMVKLVFACFKVYYTNSKMFPGLPGHFRRVLILLRRFCDRTTSMKMQRIVRGVVRTTGLDRALHGLLKGLDSRALRPKRASARIAGTDNQPEDTEFANDHEREWSQDEGLALIDGLQAYQGPDRYLQIIRHSGHRLRHRTQRELRAKALQVHDRMQPTIAAQLETEDGRRRWGWLLSVRGS